MGGTGSPVPNGDFTFEKGWKIHWREVAGVGLVPQNPPNGNGLIRSLANDDAPSLPIQDHIDAAFASDTYDSEPWDRRETNRDFRNTIEGWVRNVGATRPSLHNRVHVWVGGDLVPATSPNDPIFFLHHCFVDKLWADWQALYPNSQYAPKPPVGSPPDPLTDLLGHRWDDPMFPWNDPLKPKVDAPDIVRVRDVWNHKALGYTYDNTAAPPPGCFDKLRKLFDP
jgi:tyrosinase